MTDMGSTPRADDLKRAKEVLAATYERLFDHSAAADIRSGKRYVETILEAMLAYAATPPIDC